MAATGTPGRASVLTPDFGVGIYSFPAAARIIRHRHPRATATTLRRWVHNGLTPASFGRSGRSKILSFHDLLSLELVRRFREKGVSLQKVRKLEAYLRKEYPHLRRPFANELFFTDGSTIWHELNSEPGGVIEVVGARRNHFVWSAAIRTFADEIRYEDGQASGWQLSPWVEVDPTLQFGAPVVRGTRLPVSVVARELTVASVEEIASWHGLQVEQIQGVRKYLVTE